MGMTNTNADYAGECDPTNTPSANVTAEQVDSAAENPNFVNEDQTEDLVMITNLSNFAAGIVGWHTDICNQAVHAMQMPEIHPTEGTHIRIRIHTDSKEKQDEEGMRVLAPEEIEAFKAGIRYVYDQFKELPFKFLPTDADGNVQPEYASEQVEQTDAKQTP